MKTSVKWVRIPLILIFVIGMTGQSLHAQQVMHVNNTRVNLRSSPGVRSDNILSTVPEETRVTVVQRQGAWYEVRLPDGQQGWISQWLLTPDRSGSPGEGVAQSQPQTVETATKNAASALPAPSQFADIDAMVHIPAGTYIVGSSQAEIQQISTQWNAKIDMFTDELNTEQMTISGFYIDAYEVTNADYYEFVSATRYPPPPDWSDGFYKAGTDNHPVTFITWEDAAAYAQWAGKRLPTAEEWEVAARGRNGRIFPWGASYSTQNVNVNYVESGVMAVGASTDDISEFGVYDMGGNVMEWTMTQYDRQNDFFVVKGGSWVSEPFVARGANKTPSHVDYRLDHLGFRCVK